MATSKKSSAMSLLDDLIGQSMTFGSLLQNVRETDDVSQAELARRLGISKSHLCDIEKGRKAVSPERAARFASELGYSEEQFVRLALQQMVADAGLHFEVALSPQRGRARGPKRAA